MKINAAKTWEIIIFGLMVALACYVNEVLDYQKYLKEISSRTEIIFHAYWSGLTLWNFAVPMMFLAAGFRAIRIKYFKYRATFRSEFLEGLLLGLICMIFGGMLTYLNNYWGELASGQYGDIYSKSLPLNGYPVNIIIIIPVINIIFYLFKTRLGKIGSLLFNRKMFRKEPGFRR